jgi:hypothetical protein
MQVITKLSKILKRLHVKKYYDVAMRICQGNEHLFYYNLFDHNNELQNGGSKHTTLKYKNEKFKFYVFNEGNSILYNLYQNDNIDKIPECLVIAVDKKEKFAYINGISYDGDCFQIDSIQKSGSTLFKVALLLIEKIKGHYGLKHIQLKDNSNKYCEKSRTNIELSSLYMLTKGDTWYGSYGFLPFDVDKKMLHKSNFDDYIQNKSIVKNTLLKDTEIIKYLIQASKELNLKISRSVFDKLYDKYKDESVQYFFLKFMGNFDKYCELFALVYKKLMKQLGLNNLHGVTYYKLL